MNVYFGLNNVMDCVLCTWQTDPNKSVINRNILVVVVIIFAPISFNSNLPFIRCTIQCVCCERKIYWKYNNFNVSRTQLFLIVFSLSDCVFTTAPNRLAHTHTYRCESRSPEKKKSTLNKKLWEFFFMKLDKMQTE